MQKLNIVYKYNDSLLTKPLCAALSYLGHEALVWWQEQKPTFDMLYEKKPDILICHGSDINSSILNGLKQFNQTRLVIIDPRPDQREFASYYCYSRSPKSNQIDGLEIIKPFANTAQYGNGKYVEELSSDILMLTDDDSIIDYKILGMLTDSSSKYRFKVFGSNRINIPQYLGDLTLQESANAMASTKITIDFGINYVTYAANQVYTMTHFDNEYWPRIEYSDYLSTIDKMLSEEKLRKKQIKQAFKLVKENTIIDRAKYILNKLGYT